MIRRYKAPGASAKADPKKRVPEDAEGDFFVDATCIDCDACRQIAPAVFGQAAATPRQVESVRRLADYRFEWVLPGHGQRVHLPAREMRGEVLRLAKAAEGG
ncbi:MAG: 4Fe-4S domain-containing protein [Gemmataceae bacterium]